MEAQNLDTIQAMQIRMNLQQLFTMSAESGRRFLDRWNVWVQVCDLAPMKRLAKTITAKSEGILRSIATSAEAGKQQAALTKQTVRFCTGAWQAAVKPRRRR